MADHVDDSDSTTLLAIPRQAKPAHEPAADSGSLITPTHLQDARLHCLKCDYNLTGITSDRCPECGCELDWDQIKHWAALELSTHGTRWERSSWLALPLALITTTLEVMLMPWIFARQIGSQHRVWPAVGFAITCMAIAMVIVPLIQGEETQLSVWLPCVIVHIVLQTFLFALVLRPQRIRHPIRFWFVISAYTTYPVLFEMFSGPPYITLEQTNIWPLVFLYQTSGAWGNSPDVTASTMYYLWLAGLVTIAYQRLPHHRRWYSLLMIVLIPLLTVTSYYVAGHVMEWLEPLFDWLKQWWSVQ